MPRALQNYSVENWIISVHVGKGADIGRPWLTVVELGSSNSIFVARQFQHFVEGLKRGPVNKEGLYHHSQNQNSNDVTSFR